MIILADGCAGILADVERFIGGNAERNGSLDAPFGDLFAVDEQLRCTRLAEAAAVVGEIKDDGVIARRKRVRGRHRVTKDAYGVVMEDRLSGEHVQAPSVEAPALRLQDSFRARRRDRE